MFGTRAGIRARAEQGIARHLRIHPHRHEQGGGGVFPRLEVKGRMLVYLHCPEMNPYLFGGVPQRFHNRCEEVVIEARPE